MGIFGLGKKRDDVVDLGEMYKREKSRMSGEVKESGSSGYVDYGSGSGASGPENSDSGMGSFFGGMASAGAENSGEENQNVYIAGGPDSAEEKRKKLAKRLGEMTDKIEELSNQVYHLQQRIEVLEKKARAGVYDGQ